MSSEPKKRPIHEALDIVKDTPPLIIFGRREHGYVLSDGGRDRLLVILSEANAASGTTDDRSAAKRQRTVKRNAKR